VVPVPTSSLEVADPDPVQPLTRYQINKGYPLDMLRKVLFTSPKRRFSSAGTTPFHYQPLFELAPDTTTEYKKLENASKYVKTVDVNGIHLIIILNSYI
jgi:hypothetical protein